jgi:hypothetical protein
MPMGIPRVNVRLNKFLLSLPTQGRYIEYLLPLAVLSLRCLFHVQDINLESRTHNKHGDHLTKGDIHACSPLWQNLVPFTEHIQIDFLFLNNLDNPIKGYALHRLGNL